MDRAKLPWRGPLDRWARKARRKALFEAFRTHPFAADHPWAFEHWCAANDHDPRGFFDKARRRGAGMPPPPSEEAFASRDPRLDPRGSGWTPLHEACYLGHLQALEGLCRAHPEWIDRRDARGVSPLRALFIFNDTSPGWKSASVYSPQASHVSIASDDTLAACALLLATLGAKPRGGELCSAAHMGLPASCRRLMDFPHAHADQPDRFFPDWPLTRGWLAVPAHQRLFSFAMASAFDGRDRRCALDIALGSPARMDAQNAMALCRVDLHALALSFLDARPTCAQAALEACLDQTEPPVLPEDARALRLLIERALALGADPRKREHPSPRGFLSEPIKQAALHSRGDLLELCEKSLALSEPELRDLIGRQGDNIFAAPGARQRSVAVLERQLLGAMAWEAEPAPKAAPRRL